MISVCYLCKEAKEINHVAPLGNKYCRSCWDLICQFMLFIEKPNVLQLVVDCARQFYVAKGIQLPEMQITK